MKTGKTRYHMMRYHIKNRTNGQANGRTKSQGSTARLVLLCLLLTLACGLGFAGPASAELYRWVDENGMLHVTDDFMNVPEEYRYEGEVEIGEERVPSEAETRSAPVRSPSYKSRKKTSSTGGSAELYGEKTLIWWRNSINGAKKKIKSVEDDYEKRKQYVNVFERGRFNSDQLFEKDEVERYEAYKENLPEMEERIEELKKDLKDLRRKATYHGVPKKVRQ